MSDDSLTKLDLKVARTMSVCKRKADMCTGCKVLWWYLFQVLLCLITLDCTDVHDIISTIQGKVSGYEKLNFPQSGPNIRYLILLTQL